MASRHQGPRYVDFPYLEFSNENGDKFLRPALWVRVTNLANRKCGNYLAIVDSGADSNLFPGEIGDQLGHDIAKGAHRPSRGVGGSCVSFIHKENSIQICAQWKPVVVDIAFTELPKPNEVNDPDAMAKRLNICLLGQIGFFDSYRVIFDRDKKIFTVIPHGVL